MQVLDNKAYMLLYIKYNNDISALPDKDREHILYTIDGLIKSAKLQAL